MPSLSETAAFLSRMRQTAEASLAAAFAENEIFVETADFGANPGRLRMLTYMPPGLAKDAPLVVVLHGCTQRAEAFAVQAGWTALADRAGFGVLAPEQSPTNNPNRCFNWFEPRDIARGRGEAGSIRAMIAEAVGAHHFDRKRIYISGLSAGGAMTAAMLAAYPEVFAGAAIIAGVPFGAAENVRQGLAAMRGDGLPAPDVLAERVRHAASARRRAQRIAIWQGDADRTVNRANGAALAQQWTQVLGLPSEPAQVEALDGRTRTRWRSAQASGSMVELNLLSGLDHGAPLAAEGPDGLGFAAPFMLEAGVSSTLETARFWGIAPPGIAAAPLEAAAANQTAVLVHEPSSAITRLRRRLAGR
jgi:poly(hydroxyalkanoate) depolymerase family esterase